MLVDHEKVVSLLKREIVKKGSHGQRDLLATIARLEAECAVEEGVPERALRLYGVVLSDDLLSSHEPSRVSARDDADDPRIDGAGSTVRPKETQHVRGEHPHAGRARAAAAAAAA